MNSNNIDIVEYAHNRFNERIFHRLDHRWVYVSFYLFDEYDAMFEMDVPRGINVRFSSKGKVEFEYAFDEYEEFKKILEVPNSAKKSTYTMSRWFFKEKRKFISELYEIMDADPPD